MKKYKFITIKRAIHDKHFWRITNNKSGEYLGAIKRWESWKQYVFTADRDSIWSADCLRDVIDFIENEIPKAKLHER